MRKLSLVLAVCFLAACAKEESDSTTAPPPTVPVPKPGAPAPGKTNGTPTTPGVKAVPVTPVAPAPLVPFPQPVVTTPNAAANVIWNCTNPVTNRKLEVNGYVTDLGDKFYLRPMGQAPIELSKLEAEGTGRYSSGQRFCAKTNPGTDTAQYMFEVRGSFSDAKRGALQAVLTRYRNLPALLSCQEKPKLADYDLKEAFNCTLGATAFINPDRKDDAGTELVNFGLVDYGSSRVLIRSIKRDTLGNTYVLATKNSLVRLDKQLKLDAQFGANGQLTVELPREVLNDQVEKVFEISPDNNGGFVALVQLQRSGDVAAVHLTAKGDLQKSVLINGFSILKTGFQPNTKFEDAAIVLDGQVIFAQFNEDLFWVKGGAVTSVKDRLKEVQKVFHTAKAANGGVFVTWRDKSDYLSVTKINSDGTANGVIVPNREARQASDYGNQGTIPTPDGGFFFVYKGERQYGTETLRIDRVSASGSRDGNYEFSYVKKAYSDVMEVDLKSAVAGVVQFADGSLGLPFRWGALRSDSKQAGVLIVGPTGKTGPDYRASLGGQDIGLGGGYFPWAVVKDDGSVYSLAVYVDRDTGKNSYHLILTKVSP